jgi:hypothetical protein
MGVGRLILKWSSVWAELILLRTGASVIVVVVIVVVVVVVTCMGGTRH